MCTVTKSIIFSWKNIIQIPKVTMNTNIKINKIIENNKAHGDLLVQQKENTLVKHTTNPIIIRARINELNEPICAIR